MARTARRLAARSSPSRLAQAFDAVELPWLTCKGAVVAARHERPEHREFNDLDLLVPGSRLAQAIEIADSVGVESINRNWAAFARHGVGEIPLVDGSVWIDLHWHVVGLERSRRDLRIDSVAMLERRRRIPFGDGTVSIFGEVDEVLHLALHAGLSGGGRLAWLRDIRVVSAANRPDWDNLVILARQARIATIVGQVLDRARRLVGAEVPDGVAEALVPTVALAAARRLDRRRPTASALERRVGSGSIVRIGRDDIWSTIRAGTKEAEAKLRTAAGRPHQWDVADPDGTLYWATSSGDGRGFDRYLAIAAAS